MSLSVFVLSVCERERENFWEKLPVTSKFCSVCVKRRHQGLVIKKGSGSGRRRGCKFKKGELGKENINRACGVEAACHGLLQEKD